MVLVVLLKITKVGCLSWGKRPTLALCGREDVFKINGDDYEEEIMKKFFKKKVYQPIKLLAFMALSMTACP